MANQIVRNVYVLQDSYKEPIPYTRFTNAIHLVFNFQDYTIPENATAQVFCAKPSGAAVYENASISGNTVTVNVTDQMFIELGITTVQIKLTIGTQTLVTFEWPVIVKPNNTEGDIPQSENQSGFWDQLQQQVNEAVSGANTAAGTANTAAQSANTAAQSATNAAQSANTAAESANTAASTANEAAQNVDQAVAAAITPEALQNFVFSYFEAHPVSIATPELVGNTISFTNSIDPTAQLQQQVNALQEFADQFDGKTIYTT